MRNSALFKPRTLKAEGGVSARTRSAIWSALVAARAWTLDAWLLLALVPLALAVRLPNYRLIPVFTDEMDEVYHGLLAASGQLFPLTSKEPYIGSLWNWLLAAGFWLSGFSLETPRTLTLGLGVVTVLATYPLGRAWGGRPGGVLAAALLSTSAVHVVVNSRVAWSNCLTPLFTTLAAWTLYEASRRQGRSGQVVLMLSGLLWGLAVQTHPSVVALLPGAAIFVLWKARSLLRTPALYPAFGLFLLANLNLIIHNLTSELSSFAQGARVAGAYAQHRGLTLELYVDRLRWLLLSLTEGLSGAVDQRASAAEFLLDPGAWPITLLALAGLVWQWRRGNPLPALLSASLLFLLPLVFGRLGPRVEWPISMLNGRYLAPLLPILFACVGALIADSLQQTRLAQGARPAPVSAPAWLDELTLLLGTLFLLIHPLFYLSAYYERIGKTGLTNAGYYRVLDTISYNRQAGEVVAVDQSFQRVKPGAGAAWSWYVYRTALAVKGVPHRLVDPESDDLLLPAAHCRDQLVILAPRGLESERALVERLGLRRLDQVSAEARDGAIGGRVYRLPRAADAPSSC